MPWEQLEFTGWLISFNCINYLCRQECSWDFSNKLNSHSTNMQLQKTVSCISRQEIERFVLNYKKEKTLTTKTVALQCNDLCAMQWSYESKSDVLMKNNRICLGQMKKGLDPSFRIWENVHTEIWCAQYVIFFCVCKLPFDSV